MSIGQNDLYLKSILTKSIKIPFNTIGPNLEKRMVNIIKKRYEGKCILEGFIKPDSCNIVSYSSGTVIEGDSIVFNVVFRCEICLPYEGMDIECIVENITKAGIKAVLNVDKSPLIIFLARDHHYNNKSFSSIKQGDAINVKIIGKRFELNDKFISVIGKFNKLHKKTLQIGEEKLEELETSRIE